MTESIFKLPLDWNEWRSRWAAWRGGRRPPGRFEEVRQQIPGKNFLADEILGTFRVERGIVELSEVTFPNLVDRDDQTGRLLGGNVRGIGLTWVEPWGGLRENTVVHSFEELETAIGLRS